MNDEKNNIGVNNNGLPPMNTVPTGNVNSQNMSTNNLPPMGSMPSVNNQLNNNTVNIQDKYGLPPISNFTNFNTGYEAPKVDDNTSVFDLMSQFENVNNGNVNNGAVNNVSPIQNSVPNNSTINQVPNILSNTSNNQGLNTSPAPVNSTPGITPVNNINQTNTVDHTLDIFNGVNYGNVGLNSNASDVNSAQSNVVMPNTPSIDNTHNISTNIPTSESINNVPTPSIMPNTLNNSSVDNTLMNMFSGNRVEPVVNSIQDNGLNVSNGASNNNQVNNAVTPTVVNQKEQATVLSNVNTSPIESVNNQNTVVDNTNSIGNSNSFIPVTNFVSSNVAPTVISNENNEDNVVEIPTTSIENETDNSGLNINNTIGNTESIVDSVSDNNVEDLITSFDTDNNIVNNQNNTTIDTTNNTINNNANNTVNNNSSSNDKPKKKKGKLLFIILLIITILILTAVGVLSYFMFFKTDKLVCGLQDYSNEEYILDESMVFRFKGNKMTDAKLSQVLTFTEDNLDKKDSYLEELKNQYQGLGFNVSFIENEDGFEIDMSFTKSELEEWYGNGLKNSSKNQMKKEMRDSGYTCK